jgi:hypothetical protein
LNLLWFRIIAKIIPNKNENNSGIITGLFCNLGMKIKLVTAGNLTLTNLGLSNEADRRFKNKARKP